MKLKDPFFIAPDRLVQNTVALESMQVHHALGLYEVGKDPEIWEWLSKPPFKSLQDADQFIKEAIDLRERGSEFPFVAIHLPTGQVAGSTRYLDISEENRALEIGWTWYGVGFQRTSLNTECKLLLMEYAFETLKAVRVQFKTDSRNLKSQAAIVRVGAKLEGTLRKHRILAKDGYVRDSVYFSVISEEWADVKRSLLERLSRAETPPTR